MDTTPSPPLAYLDAYLPEVPALYTQLDFEAALDAVGFARLKQRPIGLSLPLAHYVRRVAGRIARNLQRGRGSRLLCLMMGPTAFRLVPDGIQNRCALHCWDTWPDNFNRWDSLFTRFRTEVALFTSRQARDRFQARFPGMNCYWMPDGSSPELHLPGKLLSGRSIDVLEIGRRFDRYHEAITPELVSAGSKHLYEMRPGQIVFPNRNAMIAGLADTKIVVCFPASVSNPARAAIETITPRYFEAMASGCLVVGHCPADLEELLGYNPVIEADIDCAAGQIRNILNDVEQYQDLVCRNLAAVKENTWIHRAMATRKILEAL
jgi:hypothetical protein